MKHLATALLAFGIMLAALPAARAADTSCTTTLTGTISGNVDVPPRRICILNAATVTGNVTVEAGATLGVDNGSTVEGNISGDRCQGVEIGVTGTATNSVHGNVSIQNCTQGGYGTPGQPLPLTQINGNFLCQGVVSGCGANFGSVGGNVQVDDNPGGALVSNHRLISADETGVTFTWKDYRVEGPGRHKTMTLPTYHQFFREPQLTHLRGVRPWRSRWSVSSRG